MDRLVKVEVAEVELHFRPSERCTAAVKITSLIHTMPVAVKLTATRPALYSFSPAAVALLPPLSSAVLTLVLHPTAAPPISSSPDVVLLSSALTPALHRADTPALLRYFSRPSLPLFRDATIPILLLGPYILRHLLLSPDSSSLVSRVIPSCSPTDLSETLTLAAASASASADVVLALITAGADPNARSSNGKSALAVAISAGRVEIVKALIDAGAADRPFHEAAAGNRMDLIHLLVGSGSGSWADESDGEGRTPVHAAAENGGMEALRFCLAEGGGDPDRADARGWTPLHCAAAGGHIDAAELIIASSAFDPRRTLTREGRGKSRRTPLDLATKNGHAHLYELLRPGGEMIRAVRAGGSEMIRAVRAGGSEMAPGVWSEGGMEEKDQNGWTALHVAAFKGRMEAVTELVEGGAELEVVDNDGYTPLQCAVEAGHAEVALWLIGRGARGGVKGILMAADDAVCATAPMLDSCAAVVSAALCGKQNSCSNKSMGIEA